MQVGSVSGGQGAAAVEGTPKTYEGAMLGKIKDQMEAEGEAAVDLIEAAKPSRPPEGMGQLVNDVA